MDYIRRFKNIANSHYLSEGVRITAGVLLPALGLGYFGMLQTGIVISLGALFVSVTDSPGPIHHRKNGMLACVAALFLITLLAGLLQGSQVFLAILLVSACFFFSMIGIYGARAASVGTATMIVLTISLDPKIELNTPLQVLRHSFIIASGGLWYMSFSMLLYNFRPYIIAQQALGDYIQSTAEFLRLRSGLYAKNVDIDKTFPQLLQQQAVVQLKQTELTELLFKTRSFVTDSTKTGRKLLMIHLEIADIFERIMMSHQQYAQLHSYFSETGILNDFHGLTGQLAATLEEIGIAVKSGEKAVPNTELAEQVAATRNKLDALRISHLKPDNIEGFIYLRRILENIQDITNRLNNLYSYTVADAKIKAFKQSDLDQMVSHQPITVAMFFDNLTLRSDTFRHSLRVSLAILAGFLTARFAHFGHSYWIMLTIVVILKPAFSLTRKRNADRLFGTISGLLIGMGIVYFVHNQHVLLFLLIVFMLATYSLLRLNYFWMVLFMTPYLILFYQFLRPQDFTLLLKDRLIDTAIGSAIAFIASAFLFPLWERERITPLMVAMVNEVKIYFEAVSNTTAGLQTQKQVARKNVLVALANLTDAFNRMLKEPRHQRVGIESLYQFVVLNHQLTSYIATLSFYLQNEQEEKTTVFSAAVKDIIHNLDDIICNLGCESAADATVLRKDSIRKLNEQSDELLLKRKTELQNGMLETSTRKTLFNFKSLVNQVNLIYNATVEISKISQRLKME